MDPSAQKSASQVRVLIADDNRDAADTLALLLKIKGYDVRSAYDGKEAFEIASQFFPAVAVLDIGMPVSNGFQTAQAMRKQPWGEHMILIAATGWGEASDRQKTREAGFDHHLVKPLDSTKLLEILSALAKKAASNPT